MASSQDTEITLGTGKMLVLFFGLVILCAVFFGMGFSLGRTSAKPTAELQGPASPATSATRQPSMKPAASNGTTDLTFYKAVEQKDSDTQSVPADASPAASEPVAAPATPAPSAPEPVAAPATNGYYVQVAAVTKQEDAQALVDNLKKKQYPAIANNSSPVDRLYHVQVGPFADLRDAEAMRARLVSDGYNPILKK
jgi:cell division septation protein DedD